MQHILKTINIESFVHRHQTIHVQHRWWLSIAIRNTFGIDIEPIQLLNNLFFMYENDFTDTVPFPVPSANISFDSSMSHIHCLDIRDIPRWNKCNGSTVKMFYVSSDGVLPTNGKSMSTCSILWMDLLSSRYFSFRRMFRDSPGIPQFRPPASSY